jgi:isochorismate pyruvate lyase
MKKCNTLQEVREEIDKIDEQLVELISKRTHLVSQAVKFKNSVEEVKADDRINAIMQRVRKLAIEKNINPNIISELFTVMINDMVETEIAEFRNAGKF